MMLKNVVSLFTLRNVYFAKFQSLVSYGLIFLGGESESGKVLKIQKRILHLMRGVNSRTSRRPIFKELRILLPLFTFLRCCAIFRNIMCTLLEMQIYMNIILESNMTSMYIYF
jgi:hypothetical protein